VTKLVHGLLQLLATVAQVAPVASAAVPLKWKAIIVALGSLAQGVLAVANHGANGAATK
jgi:hypothetical protein